MAYGASQAYNLVDLFLTPELPTDPIFLSPSHSLSFTDIPGHLGAQKLLNLSPLGVAVW